MTVTGAAIAVVVVVLLIWTTLEVLLLMFAGVLVAVLLGLLGSTVARTPGLGYGMALTLVLAAVIAVTTLGVLARGPEVAAEMQTLAQGMSDSVEDLKTMVSGNPMGLYALENFHRIDVPSQQMWSQLTGVSATVVGFLGAILIVVFVGIFVAYNPPLYVNGLLRLVPLGRRARVCEVMAELGVTLRWWMLGQLASMVILWLSTWLVLHLLGVPLAFTLGLLTGLLTFIPYLGPLIAVIPIAVVAFMHDPALAVLAVGAFLVIQAIESNLIMPIVFQKTVHLPPALTVVSQLVMGSVLGFLGVLLATPLLAVALVLVRMLYVEDALGDDLDEPVENPEERLPG
ncbi:MAG: AI-2E family transporter [Pseudomonadota bacterium]|nr:AI-2E family transporter [Pseudomonadota bacterium]